jgi:5-methylcytosine-specific restriction endonuclease McrA
MDAECFYCGQPLYRASRNTDLKRRPLLTMDHVIPRSRAKGRGQPDVYTVPCCEGCNNEKGALTLEEYRVLKAFRYGYIQEVNWKFSGEDEDYECRQMRRLYYGSQ